MKREDREGLQAIVNKGIEKLLSGQRSQIAPRYAQAAALLQLDLAQREAGEEVVVVEKPEPVKVEDKKPEPAKKAKEKVKKEKSYEIDLQE